MRRFAPLVAALALAGGLAPAGATHDPPFGSPEWIQRDLANQADAHGRLADQYTNPAYHSLFFTRTHGTWHANISEQLEEPTRPRLTIGQWAPGGTTGDPFRLDWEEQGRGIQVPVSFLNRNGAKLNGHLWAPAHADAALLPGIVITTGSIQAPEAVYYWAAQGLAEAGYMVLTYDVQGQGRSETFGHAPDGTPTCGGGGCPSQQTPNFVNSSIDALDFLVSTPAQPYTWEPGRHNPLHQSLDRSRLGLAGHSLGATGVTFVQDVVNRPASMNDPAAARFAARGIALPVVDTIVAWDNLSADPTIVPRVPAMGQNGEYFLNVVPGAFLNCGFGPCQPGPPDPDLKRQAFLRWRTAGLDTMQVAFGGSTHLEWSFVPYILPASRKGERVAMYYTLAWFDRYLMADPTALDRLIGATFDASADASAIGTGAYDPATGENVPHVIEDEQIADHLSVYFTSSYFFGAAGGCEDMRHGCP